MSSFRFAPSLGAFVLFAAVCSSCAAPVAPVALRAPGRVTRALAVVSDLGCTATLFDEDGDVRASLVLTRGEDGVSFSGFLSADPGTYTLVLVFDGVIVGDATGERVFLGRLTSDSFTVVAGDTTSPSFSRGLDTIGEPGDGGDEDDDGLGLLDELLSGGDPDDADSDDDGVRDGDDCAPDDAGNAFVIDDDGSLDDCDGDGFVRVDPIFAESGNDCADDDASVHPGAADDCGTIVDEDCSPATCPVDDREGPEITVLAPADGAIAGCGAVVVADIADPSGVTGASARFVDDPLGGSDRALVLRDDDGDGVWRSQPLVTLAGTGYRPGVHDVEITATDGVGNSRRATMTFTLVIDAPAVTITGAPEGIIEGAAVDVTFGASAPDPIVRFVVFQAPSSATFPSLFDLTQASVLRELPVAGGTVRLDPADFAARSVVYAVVEDAVGRLSAPFASTTVSVSAAETTAQVCDGDFSATVPAIVVEPPQDAADLVSLRDLLGDATARAAAIDPTARLAAVFALGVDGDGHVDLGDVGNFSKRWEYRFLKGAGGGITVRYLTAAFGPQFPDTPQIEEPDDPLDSEALVADGAVLVDSDAAMAVYDASGCGTFTADDNDMILLQHAGGRDRLLLQANAQGALIIDAVTLEEIARDCR